MATPSPHPSRGKHGTGAWLTLLAVVVAFGMVITSMVGKRYQQADHYPDYSTLRADPLGTRALHDALDRMPGVTVLRNFQPMKKLEGAPGKVLILPSISASIFESPFELDSLAVARFAASGGRVIIALDPSGGSMTTRTYHDAMDEVLEEEMQERRRKKKEEEQKKEKESAPKLLPVAAAAETQPEQEDKQDKEEKERLEKRMKERGRDYDKMPPLAHVLKLGMDGGEFMLTDKGGSTITPDLALGLKQQDLPLWYSNLYLDDTRTTDYRAKFTSELLARLRERRDEQDRRDGILRPDSTEPRRKPSSKSYQQLRSEVSPWVALARRGDRMVLAERQMGSGSIVVASDRYFLSNQALWKEPKPVFLSWLLGDVREVIFEETALGPGIGDEDGIMTLARRYRMHGLFFGGLLFFILYLWRNASTLVPRDERRDLGLWRADAVAGQSTASGLEGLLRRGVRLRELLSKCLDTWSSTGTAARMVKPPRIHEAQALLRDAQQSKTLTPKNVPQLYSRIISLLHQR
jgi:hypothetical protein